jgi:hypothetical protein
MFTTAASIAIFAVTPASALAKHHAKRHHSRTHHARVHHLRIRHERFGAITSSSPTAPTTPAQTAGTVDSLVGNVLTIRLNDTNHTLVSGMVTDNTRIECAAPATTGTIHEDGDQGGGDNSSGSGDNSTSGDDNTTSSGSDETAGTDDQNEVNDPSEATEPTEVDDQGDDDGQQTMTACTTANLVPNAVVNGAELGISSAGATWEKVELAG